MILVISLWAVSLATSLIGVEMTINPPNQKNKKWYRVAFICLGLLGLGLAIPQYIEQANNKPTFKLLIGTLDKITGNPNAPMEIKDNATIPITRSERTYIFIGNFGPVPAVRPFVFFAAPLEQDSFASPPLKWKMEAVPRAFKDADGKFIWLHCWECPVNEDEKALPNNLLYGMAPFLIRNYSNSSLPVIIGVESDNAKSEEFHITLDFKD
jgi:hypothetical protein